jgi:hypothetical protein
MSAVHAPISLPGLFLAALLIMGISAIMTAAALILFRRLMSRSRATPCAEIREEADRRPDPCLYSQAFILKFFPGQPVTWDNPDIELTELDGTPVTSGDLKASHDYVVLARIWDASFSPALGTAVRCSYHGFGFSSPASQAVETEPDGSPKVVFIHIAPWQNATAKFIWTTPNLPSHYCLLVECSHPADANTWNNLVQGNTVVRTARRGAALTVDALLANRLADRPQRFRFSVDSYTIPERDVELTLRVSESINNRDAGELRYASGSRRGLVRYAYGSRSSLLECCSSTRYS